MDDFNVAARVQDLCKARSWSLYRLAKEAGMPYSSLSTILYKNSRTVYRFHRKALHWIWHHACTILLC